MGCRVTRRSIRNWTRSVSTAWARLRETVVASVADEAGDIATKTMKKRREDDAEGDEAERDENERDGWERRSRRFIRVQVNVDVGGAKIVNDDST
eukprot:CAMPEP_0118893688 /NCGR_PEP_ID=MMETSP1166-20130328/2799_1 /TAXON_ID=1104430 /ORGANISM="Chrysoreinhardia sp, Strain CCMP3193" /LENGTH=94 /DNA_ID=CAMNT_0006832527 /DNA_START=77 /DNA_END=361 /DNA_ORIENTATION=+